MISNILKWEVDYHGQKLAERLGQFLIVVGLAAGTIIGFSMQSLQVSVIVWAIASALTLIICVPPWPFLNRHPIKWQPAKFSKIKARVTAEESDAAPEEEPEPASSEPASPTKAHHHKKNKHHHHMK